MSFSFKRLISPAVLGSAALLTAACNYNELIYPGKDMNLPDAACGYAGNSIVIPAEDGTALHGWFFNRGYNKPLVLWYPGKCSHVGHFVHTAANDPDRSYLLMNYRGYGWSKGAPNEHNIVSDARHCLAWARQQIGGYSSLVTIGYSLGTGVAVQVAAAENADKLILLAPYDCMYNAAVNFSKNILNLPNIISAPAAQLCAGSMFNSAQFAPQVTCPVLIFFAEHDAIIPHESTWNLFHSFTSTYPDVHWVSCPHEGIMGNNDFWAVFWNYMTQDRLVTGRNNAPWIMNEKGDNHYYGRNGYAKDANKALAYYRCAADAGYDWGMHNVGKCYLEGQGVCKNDDEARHWFRKSYETSANHWSLHWLAQLGDAEAQKRLAHA